MEININPELNFKFKKTLEKKIKKWDFDFQDINNINLITHNEFMDILINKLAEFDPKFKSLLNKSNIDYVKNKFIFDTIMDLLLYVNKVYRPMYLYFWTNKHEEILNNFINTLKSNEAFMNLLYNLIFNFIYENEFIDNSYKLSLILKLYLLLLDPKYMIFSPSIVASKSTFKILSAERSVFSIEKASLLDNKDYYYPLLLRFSYINNFSKHQNYLLKLQNYFFKSLQEEVISKYFEDNNIKNLKIYFLKEDIRIISVSINKLFSLEFDNIISHVYLYDSIKYLEPSKNLPYEYNLGYFYKFSLEFKYQNFNITFFYDISLKYQLFKIYKITKQFFNNKLLKICKKLNIDTRNKIYYSFRKESGQITMNLLENKQLELYEIFIEYLKPLFIMQKIFINKKVNYKIKKI